MKKLIIAFLTVALSFCAFACGTDSDIDTNEKEAYTFVMPDGAPVLAAINLIKNYPEIDGHKMEYKIVPAANIGQEFLKNAQLAVMPTNAAAKLYNAGNDLRLASVNVFGVMYMIGQTELSSLEDLKGKVVYSIGEGNTPDLLMKYFLKEAGVEYVKGDTPVDGKVSFVYVNEAPNVIQAMMAWQSGKTEKRADYGVIGQPAVKGALAQLTDTKIVFDFQKEWKDDNDGTDYPQAGVVVMSKVAENSSFIAALRQGLAQNYEYISANPTVVNEVLAANGSSLKMSFDKALIDSCNLSYKSATEAKTALEAYFTKSASNDESAKNFFGGKLPSVGFYVA